MADKMTFPKTFDDFAEQYKIIDKEVYTNGAELIPIFRVRQWLEHKAGAVKVKHGKWEDVVVYNDTCIATCSSCRQLIVERECNATAFKLENKFCRKCGAKMDE